MDRSSVGRHPATALSFYHQYQGSDADGSITNPPDNDNAAVPKVKYDRKRQAKICPKGMHWLPLGVLLGIYVYQCRRIFVKLSAAIAPTFNGILPPASGSRKSMLPKRIISVFGTESSGSTFLATTLGIASGSFPSNGTYVTMPSDRNNNTGQTYPVKLVAKRAISPNGDLEIQHLSLPWGFWGSKKRNCLLSSETITVEALVPEPCFRFDFQSDWEHRLEVRAPAGCREEAHISGKSDATKWTCGTNNCGGDENDGYALYPRRFYVNITSHLEWYLQRGVDITAVLSVRDKTISRAGKQKMHCPNKTTGVLEEEKATSFMSDALRKYGRRGRLKQSGTSHDGSNDERVIAVSYEALMAFQEPYLFSVYNSLGIDSTFVPEFKDGNEKYVQEMPPEEKTQIEK